MARAGVTIEDVNRAAGAVQARGARVTVARVREELQTGSMDTLTPLVREWKAQNDQAVQAQPAQSVVLLPLPAPVAEALEKFGQQVWQGATAEADLQLQGAYERHRNELAVAEESCQETAEFAAAVEAQNEALKQQADELRGQLAAGQQREEQARLDRASLERELAQERDERKVAGARVQELEQRADDLNAELGRLHTTLAGERAERVEERAADQQQHAAELNRAAQEAEARLGGLRADLTRAAQDAEGRQAALRADLTQQLAAAGARVAGLETQLQASRETSEATATELRAQLDQAKEERAQARGALQPLHEQLETQKQLLMRALAHPADTREAQVNPVIRNRPPGK